MCQALCSARQRRGHLRILLKVRVQRVPKTSVSLHGGREKAEPTALGWGGVEGDPIIMSHFCLHLHDSMSILFPL